MPALRAAGKTLGLVPTMGALHPGHLSLVGAAQKSCDAVAVSIFVNPTQFGPKEDFASYPRVFEQDCHTLEAAGVDMVFAPAVEEMYPPGASTFVEVEGLSDRLDGASRPGHFRGVATVVSNCSTSLLRMPLSSDRRTQRRLLCCVGWCGICGLQWS